jgi:hypothetical protein
MYEKDYVKITEKKISGNYEPLKEQLLLTSGFGGNTELTVESEETDDVPVSIERQDPAEELEVNEVHISTAGPDISHTGQEWQLCTPEIKVAAKIVRRDKKAQFHGKVVISSRSDILDHKTDSIISNFKSKKVPKAAVLTYSLHNALCAYYDVQLLEKDMQEILAGFQFSLNQKELITRMAELIYERGTIEEDEASITKVLGKSVRDQVLQEISGLQLAELDLNDPIPQIRIGQYFNLKNNDAYVVFTRVTKVNGEIITLPYVVSNKRNQIRLDLIMQQSDQSILLLDGKYQIAGGISRALRPPQEMSLQQHWVGQYINGEIPEMELKPSLLIGKIETQIRRFFYFPDERIYKVLAVWLFGTYSYELFDEYPYLLFNGSKGTGKTVLDNIILTFAFNSQLIMNTTEAALFRSISDVGGTFIIDEMENLSNGIKNSNSGISAVLKSGYTKNSGTPLRCAHGNYAMQQKFYIYCPKVLSNINGVDPVIYDRVIEIPTKAIDPEKLQALNLESISSHRSENFTEIRELTSLCCLSAMENFQEIHKTYRNIRFTGATARVSQILRPLMALAEIAGSDYIAALHGYYTDTIKQAKADSEDNSSAGELKRSISEIALELSGRKPLAWCKELQDFNTPANAKISMHEDGFTISQFCLWLGLRTIDRGINRKSINELLKPKPKKGEPERTTITWNPPKANKSNIPGGKYTVYNYRFYFRDLIADWNPGEVVDQEVFDAKTLPIPVEKNVSKPEVTISVAEGFELKTMPRFDKVLQTNEDVAGKSVVDINQFISAKR